MKSVLILAYSKQAGGAEKSAIKLANSLKSEVGYEVSFGTLIRSDKDFYSEPSDLNLVYFFPLLNYLLRLGVPFRKLWIPFFTPFDILHMRRTIKKSNFKVIVSFGAGVGCVTYLSLFGQRVAQVVSERINPDPKVYKPSRLAQWMRPYIYRHSVVCSVQSQGFASWVKESWQVDSVITPNHFVIPEATYDFVGHKFAIIAVGRAAHQKGYDILLKTWSVVEKSSDLELWIAGDDSNGYIANLIELHNCKNVKLLGLRNDLNELFDKCALFVATSRFEGYPNAVAEAIIYGVPVLTTITSDVVHEWAEEGICLAIHDTNPERLAEQILETVTNTNLLESTSLNAKRSRHAFSWEQARLGWFQAIDMAMNLKFYTTR